MDREQLGIMYLSSCLKKAGHKTELSTMKDSLRTAKRFKPDILAYYITTGFHKKMIELNQGLREEIKAISIFGGPHPTFFPEMINEEKVDAVCIGEGEEAIVEFAERLEEGKSVNDVKNFWINDKDNIYKNPVRNLKEDLDSIPFPDRELFYSKYEVARNNKIKGCITARGCPNLCTYCFNHKYNKIYKDKGKIMRVRSVDNVIEELKQLKKYPLDLVYFATDNFLFDGKWVKEFSVKYRKEIDTPFFCLVRANLVNRNIISNLKIAGCVSVGMGIETGNDRIRNKIIKRDLTKQQIIQASRILNNEGINISSSNMLALPTENLQTAFETFDLNVKCKPAYSECTLFQPYPKTDLGRYCEEKGLFDGNINGLKYTFFETSPLKMEERERKQIENFNRLFAIGVSFPFLFPSIKQLIKLPPNKAFDIAYKIWKGYCGKNKIFVHHLTFKEYIKSLMRYMGGGLK